MSRKKYIINSSFRDENKLSRNNKKNSQSSAYTHKFWSKLKFI